MCAEKRGMCALGHVRRWGRLGNRVLLASGAWPVGLVPTRGHPPVSSTLHAERGALINAERRT